MPKKQTTPSLTPLRAIRKKCLWCCGDSRTEVKLCPASGCPIWEYRMGKRPKAATLTPIKAIKSKCRDCCGGTWADVQKCPGLKLADGPCSLHAFRLGTNPNISEESRAAARGRAQRLFLGEKPGRSPLVDALETGGRVFVHPEELGLEIDNPLFNPAAAGNTVHAGR